MKMKKKSMKMKKKKEKNENKKVGKTSVKKTQTNFVILLNVD